MEGFNTTGQAPPVHNAGDNGSEMTGQILDNVSSKQQAYVLRQVVLWSYLVTFVVGMVGNGLVIYIIAYYKAVRTKSVANYYIWNLAFADLFFIITMPFFSYTTFYQDWPFGWFFCKLANSICETNKFASVFTLVALSVDRYIASFYNLGSLRTLRVGKLVCLVVWLLCILISSPYWIFARTRPGLDNTTTCKIFWPKQHELLYLTISTYCQFIIGLVLPFCFIFCSYILLVYRLRVLLQSSAASRGSRVMRPNRKMTMTVLMVVLTFLVCQLPWHTLQIMIVNQRRLIQTYTERGENFVPTDYDIHLFQYMNSVAQILVFVSSCCNPFIYGLLNENYRKLYTVVLCRCRPVSGPPPIADGEAHSTDSNQNAEGGVTYHFQCSCHMPCTKGPDGPVAMRQSLLPVAVAMTPPKE